MFYPTEKEIPVKYALAVALLVAALAIMALGSLALAEYGGRGVVQTPTGQEAGVR